MSYFCLAGISDIGGVLQVLIEEVSQQRTTLNRVVTKIASLEGTARKQQEVLNFVVSKISSLPKGAETSVPNGAETSQEATAQASNAGVDPVYVGEGTKHIYRPANRKKHRSTSKRKSIEHHTSARLKAFHGGFKRTRSLGEVPVDSLNKLPLVHPLKKPMRAPVDNAPPSSDEDCSAENCVENELYKYQDNLSKHEWMNCIKMIEQVCSTLREHADRQKVRANNCHRSVPNPAINGMCTESKSFPECAPSTSSAHTSETVPTPIQKKLPTVTIPETIGKTASNSSSSQENPSSTSTNRLGATPTDPPTVPQPHVLAVGVAAGPLVKAMSTGNATLPSCVIDKSELISLDIFMKIHSTALREGRYPLGTLAVKLATSVIFGKEVLAKCSPFGRRGLWAFPAVEFNVLKQLVLDFHPCLWENMAEFERQWDVACKTQLSRKCSQLRMTYKKVVQ